jgi:feruloyl esterase
MDADSAAMMRSLEETHMKIPRAALLAVFIAIVMPGYANAAGTSCDSLMKLTLENATVTRAELVPAGGFKAPGGGNAAQNAERFAKLPAFCRVAATLTPTADSDIKIEVWLPASGWNGKFEAVGNGGWAGTIGYPAMAQALARGYATTSTDTGHSSPGGSFALGHPEKLTDYAYRSEHEMTVQAKAVISAFYGNVPARSYFNGCSTGGRQALTEAWRYPDDFDGIIAGAAANPKTHLDTWRIWMGLQTLRDPETTIPKAKYPAIHQAVLNACDALDGLKDGLISDPTACHFDPQVIACKEGDGASCLTPKQVQSVKTILGPAKTSTGEVIFPSYQPGTELAWGLLIGGPDPYDTALDQFRYMVFDDPKWDWRTFDVDRDMAKADQKLKGLLTSIDPKSMTAFFRRGGKLLTYQGWSDQDISPLASVNFYKSVRSALGDPAVSSSMRLFMVPGMGHCGGGEGPNTFDMMVPLEQWVEKGQAPARIEASHSTNGKVDRTRPLCPYPQVARYKGTGSIDEADNFTCQLP